MDSSDLIREYSCWLAKASRHLQYSLDKVQGLSTDIDSLSEQEFAHWESLAARFARTTDIYLTKYLRAVVYLGDPGFRGSLRDFVDAGEKAGIIDDAEVWMRIREIRNSAAHEYEEKKLGNLFEELRALTPTVLQACAKL